MLFRSPWPRRWAGEWIEVRTGTVASWSAWPTGPALCTLAPLVQRQLWELPVMGAGGRCLILPLEMSSLCDGTTLGPYVASVGHTLT